MAVQGATPAATRPKWSKSGSKERKQYINAAIYGDFGAGKTFLSNTIERWVRDLPEPTLKTPDGITPISRTLLLNAELGDDGIPPDCEEIIIWPIETYKEYSQSYQFLRTHLKLKEKGDVAGLMKLQTQFFKSTMEQMGNELWMFEAVVVDSLTEIQKYCVYQLIGLSMDSKLEDEPEYMQMRQWGVALEMILLMIRNFRGLKMHKIFIVQELEDEDDRKKKLIRPALQGQAKTSMLGFFDVVGYLVMQMKEGVAVRRLYIAPVGNFKAKNRFGKFGGTYIHDPDMVKVLQARDGTLKQQQ